MTPIRETIARAAMDARVHDLAPNVGDLIVGSEFVQSCFGDDGDDGPFFRSAYGLTIAKAVLRALEAEGWRMVPATLSDAMAWAMCPLVEDDASQPPCKQCPATVEYRGKTGVMGCRGHYADIYRAMLAAAPKVTG